MARQPADPFASSKVPSDERASSIEVQLKKSIPLKDLLRAIVLPQRLLDNEPWVESINRWNPEHIETYTLINSVNPEFFAGTIYTKVESVIKKLGYLP